MTDAEKIVSMARILFRSLPSAEFTVNTFRELGEAVHDGKGWNGLSMKLRASLIRLCSTYETHTAEDREAAFPKADPEAETPAPNMNSVHGKLYDALPAPTPAPNTSKPDPSPFAFPRADAAKLDTSTSNAPPIIEGEVTRPETPSAIAANAEKAE